MQNYHAEHGRFPPAAVRGKSGEPLYSWRVAVLPYLEQEGLFKEFDHEEPWDGPHNASLLGCMPSIYRAPGRKAALAPPDHTFVHVFVGKGTAFEDWLGHSHGTFTDGTTETILLVEGGPPVPWTKPEELPYAPDQPLPELATVFKVGFRCAMASGSVRWISRETDESTLRAAITRNGGEKLPLDGNTAGGT